MYCGFMLINFKVANFRSIESEVVLDFLSSRPGGDSTRDLQSMPESVVTTAAIFGANATGKTTVLLAYLWMVEFARTSLYQWTDSIPVQPFLYRQGSDKPTVFTVEFEASGMLFKYELTLTMKAIVSEKLFYWPNGRRKTLFIREGLEISKTAREMGSLRGAKTLLTDNVLLLSISRKFDLGPVSIFAEQFTDLLAVDLQTGIGAQVALGEVPKATRAGAPLSWFADEPEGFFPNSTQEIPLQVRQSRALELLKLADGGIADVNVVDNEVEHVFSDGRSEKGLIRNVQVDHNVNGEAGVLDLFFESRGTTKWLNLISPILAALEFGSVILIDELDSSLHPLLVEKILSLFADKRVNRNGAQLVITSHNTNLLTRLEPDQVWFADKAEEGNTGVYPLLDFRSAQISRADQRNKQYLEGRFGAIPSLDLSAAIEQFTKPELSI